MSDLHGVAKRGDPFRLRELLEQGADPNEKRTFDAGTPLMLAADYRRRINMKVLLSFGADLNLADKYGQTALGHASSLELKRLLLENGALPDAGFYGDMTEAAFAATFACWEVVDLLLEFGADPEAKNRDGRSVKELRNDPLTRDVSSFQRARLEHQEDPSGFVLLASKNLTLTPEQYLAKHPDLFCWSLHTRPCSDASLNAWALGVADLLAQPDLRAACFAKHLSGEELNKGLRTLEAQKRRKARQDELDRLEAEFEAMYFSS